MKMVPLIQVANGFKLIKQLQPFAKDPLFLHRFGYSSYTVHTEQKTAIKSALVIFLDQVFSLLKKAKQKHRVGKDAPHMTFRA